MVLVVGGILAAGFFFLFKPAYDGIGKAEKNLQAAETAHAELMTKLERLNTIDDDIKAAKEKLMNSAQALFAKVYEQAQAAGAAPGQDPTGGATGGMGGDDNVVDGDYREV